MSHPLLPGHTHLAEALKLAERAWFEAETKGIEQREAHFGNSRRQLGQAKVRAFHSREAGQPISDADQVILNQRGPTNADVAAIAQAKFRLWAKTWERLRGELIVGRASAVGLTEYSGLVPIPGSSWAPDYCKAPPKSVLTYGDDGQIYTCIPYFEENALRRYLSGEPSMPSQPETAAGADASSRAAFEERSKGGAPPKHDKELFFAFACVSVFENGVPSTKAAFAKDVLKRMAGEVSKTPDQRYAEMLLTKAYSRLRTAQGTE